MGVFFGWCCLSWISLPSGCSGMWLRGADLSCWDRFWQGIWGLVLRAIWVCVNRFLSQRALDLTLNFTILLIIRYLKSTRTSSFETGLAPQCSSNGFVRHLEPQTCPKHTEGAGSLGEGSSWSTCWLHMRNLSLSVQNCAGEWYQWTWRWWWASLPQLNVNIEGQGVTALCIYIWGVRDFIPSHSSFPFLLTEWSENLLSLRQKKKKKFVIFIIFAPANDWICNSGKVKWETTAAGRWYKVCKPASSSRESETADKIPCLRSTNWSVLCARKVHVSFPVHLATICKIFSKLNPRCPWIAVLLPCWIC